jgi:predicted Zn-dependent protease
MLVCAFGLNACAGTGINNIDEENYFNRDDDELGLWYRSDRKERILLRSGFIEEDAGLTEYVNDVLHQLVGDMEKERGIRLRAYIVSDPYFNAFMLPNGALFIHSGLIANLENEAQLAVILGHEVTHFFHRHSLKKHRSRVNKAAFFSLFQTALGPGNYTKLSRLYRNLVINSTMAGYSRELEREADRMGFKLMIKAGYDPYESKRAFELLARATKGKKKVPYFFSSHPQVKERIRNFSYLLSMMKRTGGTHGDFKGEEKFYSQVNGILLNNARLSLKCNKLDEALTQARRYLDHAGEAMDENHARALLILAMVHERRSNKDGARDMLANVIETHPGFARAYLDLGLLLYKSPDENERREARVYFEKYLQLAPEDHEAEYIKGYLHEG